MSKIRLVLIIVLAILLTDQMSKIWVKLNMTLGQEYWIFGLSWARIHFIENPGMAFGHQFGGEYGKLFLTLFRLVAATVLGWWIFRIIRQGASTGLVVCLSLILAGAMGNIIDSVFYGIIFSASSMHSTAAFLPAAGGYAPVFHGKVVDMLYFPLFEGRYPMWMPWVGGEHFLFFRPVFNIADSAITVGIALIFIFQKRFFASLRENEKSPAQINTDEENDEIITGDVHLQEIPAQNGDELKEISDINVEVDEDKPLQSGT